MTASDKALRLVLARLTARDRYLCQLLYDHDILTSRQVCQVAFTGERRTRKRLAELAGLQVIDRIRPHIRSGSAPSHCLLGTAGAVFVASDLGLTVQATLRRRDAAYSLARGQRLAHHLGANQVFTDLLAASRQPTPAGQLELWWSARRCAAEWGQVVNPDGYGIWTAASGRRLPFLLEHDMGTERLARLAAKLDGYADLTAAAGHPTQILFTFPTPEREHRARHALAPAATRLHQPIATAVLGTHPRRQPDPSGGRCMTTSTTLLGEILPALAGTPRGSATERTQPARLPSWPPASAAWSCSWR